MLRICKSRLLVRALCVSCLCDVAFGQKKERPFTLNDEIGLWLFIPDMGRRNPRFSPDGKYFAVYSERGRLDLNRPEYALRFYRSEDVENFLKTSVVRVRPYLFGTFNSQPTKTVPSSTTGAGCLILAALHSCSA